MNIVIGQVSESVVRKEVYIDIEDNEITYSVASYYENELDFGEVFNNTAELEGFLNNWLTGSRLAVAELVSTTRRVSDILSDKSSGKFDYYRKIYANDKNMVRLIDELETI